MDVFKDFLEKNHTLLFWIGGVSIFIFFISIFSLYFLLGRLSSDFFRCHFLQKKNRRKRFSIILIFKNLLGVIVVIGGFIMLFTPGQGILTILVGLLMLDFPGRKRLERYIISSSKVQKGLNLLRRKRRLELFDFSFLDE